VFLTIWYGGRQVDRRHRKGQAPGGFGAAVEALVLFVRNDVAIASIGHGGEVFAPYILTLFFFILYCNLLGLLPWGAAATGNIAIFAGGTRAAFELVLPVLSILGQRILHTGPVGSASMLKVLTNYLCTVHLAALAEALTVAKVAGLNMNTTYEAIRISSGNSFVHETESQVILNGSRDINFTMDLVIKDVGLFDDLAREHEVPLELSALVLGIFRDGARRYGEREFSPNIIRRLEDACAVRVLGEGFPAQMVDDEPKIPGYEVVPRRQSLL